MGEVLTVRTQLTDGMQFTAQAGSGHTVVMDAAEHAGGEGAGFVPMELLLVGLSGCTGMDVISVLRKKRQEVTGYEVRVRGERAEDHPMVYTTITVEHIVTGYNVNPEAVARAVELSATKYCGAGAMLGKTAKLTHTFRIIAAANAPATGAAHQPLPAIP
ncbi:MAG TPA: OsmC family protein [Ktedonobacterales bacterium]|nr:OsmC family protein [Ktedonobacterales bacterium]